MKTNQFVYNFLCKILDCIYDDYIESVKKFEDNDKISGNIDYKELITTTLSKKQIQLDKIYNDKRHPEFRNFIFWLPIMQELNLITTNVNELCEIEPKSISLVLTTAGFQFVLQNRSSYVTAP